MRFSSQTVGGYRVHAVSGVNTVSFGIAFAAADTTGLLGFAVEREDPTENEKYYMYGFKVFESVYGEFGPDQAASTFDQPVQSFVWDDFTAKPDRDYIYRFYPLKGAPKNLDRSAPPIPIRSHTEPLFSTGPHDVFFNRGVASSQAYVRKFGYEKPDEIADPAKRLAALQWLSRDLDEAIYRFIDTAQAGDSILGCFYEFHYKPVLTALKAAIDRGVIVKLIIDSKDNSYTDKKGLFHEAFPRKANRDAVAEAGIPASAIALWREANPNDIQHNKFMVLLQGAAGTPKQVWTGSTNISLGGIHGQTNVGHWVRDAAVAERFKAYWDLLSGDPGAPDGASAADARRLRAAYRDAVAGLEAVPHDWHALQPGTVPVFSPRTGLDILDMYFAMVDDAERLSCITLAFGVNGLLKDKLLDNPFHDERLTFLLLEKEDKANPKSTKPFVPLRASNNVYSAWGAYITDPIYRWTRETSPLKLGLNTHVLYIHSKFLLMDPLGAAPVIVTGSANFSEASTNANDENMLIVKGDQRAADIYFTEFNRLFFHYYFRSMYEKLDGGADTGGGAGKASKFLSEDDRWLAKYKTAGSLKAKRVAVFTHMANAQPG
ncbi:phospholipase D-like domain-containing protein [Sphingobium nicotianae]|uniref:Phospholipase D n=1 Tax=Sphingobium nicotianae TaxID=2782607 RepID=A0A9X1D9U9_9SPHN|nr:phospholipase D-like domain-containing protein [Sphingobium nicotianae]MBT2185958.1 hypothetical protein [Sphingobium nicotianae]